MQKQGISSWPPLETCSCSFCNTPQCAPPTFQESSEKAQSHKSSSASTHVKWSTLSSPSNHTGTQAQAHLLTKRTWYWLRMRSGRRRISCRKPGGHSSSLKSPNCFGKETRTKRRRIHRLMGSQNDTRTDVQTHRQTYRQADRHTHTHRQTDTHTKTRTQIAYGCLDNKGSENHTVLSFAPQFFVKDHLAMLKQVHSEQYAPSPHPYCVCVCVLGEVTQRHWPLPTCCT